jgi:hypothetical protein
MGAQEGHGGIWKYDVSVLMESYENVFANRRAVSDGKHMWDDAWSRGTLILP